MVKNGPVKERLTAVQQRKQCPDNVLNKSWHQNESLHAKLEQIFKQLLTRLLELVTKVGRVPVTVQVVVRKYDAVRKVNHRQQKQGKLPSSALTNNDNKLLDIIMNLFYKIVDIKTPFHITLLGLSFTRFEDRVGTSYSIASYLRKNVSVQEIINLQHEPAPRSCGSPMEIGSPRAANRQSSSDANSESDLESAPKRSKYTMYSPSKLRIAALRLNSHEFETNDELESSTS